MSLHSAIYNALPYVYTLGGVLAMLLSREPIGQASGVLLISAAMLVFHLRLEHRSSRAEEAEQSLTVTRTVMARSHH